MTKASIIEAEFSFGLGNLTLAPRVIKPKFRFSLWNRGMLYTPGELQEIFEVGQIMPGETARVKIIIMSGVLADSLRSGEMLYWGVPYDAIGTVKVL